jgi:bifunctional non-homologous end joining protein LigD
MTMARTLADPLQNYRAKRDFSKTGEPAGAQARVSGANAFVIQKHWARALHYDLRLELDGVMKSWAVPKGPSYDPHDKRMAMQVEDHPLDYNQFEGEIPKGQYGAGKVIIWDEGQWVPLSDPHKGYRDGVLKFELKGSKMQGHWALIRMKGREQKQSPWLLIKEKDEHARPATAFSVVDEMPDSVVPLRGRKRTRVAVGTASDTLRLPGTAASLPRTLKPQLATLVDVPPAAYEDWMFELKFDGYRMLARVEGKSVRLFTRNGHDWTDKLPQLAKALLKLKLPTAWLDGEIVVLDENGIPNFQALQNAFDTRHTREIVYYLFDIPFLAGRDMREEPFEIRRTLLTQVLNHVSGKLPDTVRLSETFDAAPRDLVTSACKMGLEGVIGKRRSAPYVTRRAESWIKLKCARRQEFVIVGYTDPQGSRKGFGALMLAVHDPDGQPRYAGNVGTGFDQSSLSHIKARLDELTMSRCPVAESDGLDRHAHWVKPVLVAEVAFGEWTRAGHIRHAVFKGLRTDKPARSIVREHASSAKPAKPAKSAMNVTHGERVIDATTGLTKMDLVRYYALVAPLLLPHLKGRPVSLVRAPGGIEGPLFFQKHLEAKITAVKELDETLDPGHAPLLEVPTPQALVSAAKMNVVELHTWNAVKTQIGKPDRMMFDLDPGEGVAWSSVQQAAVLVRGLLSELTLTSFLKTSGGKGLHIVVPLRRAHDWDTIKAFSHAIVQHLAQTLPKIFVAKSGPRNRIGKIYVDYLRNGFGATTVAAWSARARPGLGVSVPIGWEELAHLKGSAQWTIANIHTRLDTGNAPWNDYAPQSVATAMKRLGFVRKGESSHYLLKS